MDWIVAIVGALLVAAVIRDVFHTLFHPIGHGSIAPQVMKVVWRLMRVFHPDRRIASLTGPLGIALVVLTWGVVAVLGWVPLEALFGFMLLTAAVSWVLQIYPALHRRRVLALQLSTLREARRAQPHLKIESIPTNVLTGLASAIVEARNDFTQYGATYYFRDLETDASLAFSLRYAAQLAEEADGSARPRTCMAGALISAAVDSLAGLLDEEFLRLGGDTAAVIRAYAADHRHTR
ncbi:MAG: two pore domain potassium channel family protein [Mycobacterium sp.]